MDQRDFDNRKYDNAAIEHLFRRNGILTYRSSPIDDDEDSIYAAGLFQAVKVLRQLIVVEKKIVYVHCCSGISRCTTLFLCYLMLVGFPDDDYFKTSKKMTKSQEIYDDYNINPDEVPSFMLDAVLKLKKIYEKSVPNYMMVKRVIDENRFFFDENQRISDAHNQMKNAE